MAGSFDVFRKYQRSLLVAVAILAMLAFFVLPPFLQMGGGNVGGDRIAARWDGGEVHESNLERDVAMRRVVNRFLVEAAVAAGRDPSRLPLFPESEEAVVRSILINEEARKNGLTVSDAAINDFLAQWTNNLVRPEQLGSIIAGLRFGQTAVSQHDLFEVLRTELAGRNLLSAYQLGFSGVPAGWRWEYFKRLEKKAGLEVVPIPVESVAAEVPAPTEQALRALYARYKDDLPNPRSDVPGFRAPRRVKYEYFVARREAFEAEASKDVTDEEIVAFYDKHKATMFRADPEAKRDEKVEEKPAVKEGDAAKESTPAPAEKQEPKPAGQPQGSAVPPRAVRPVAFRQPTATDKAAEKPAGSTADAAPAKGSAAEAEPASDSAIDFEPLEKVKDRIREQLARDKAALRIDAIFSAIAGDVGRYAEDLALWKARGAGTAAPAAPDIKLIAEKQSLEAASPGFVTAEQAVAAGGIGQSFELIQDPGSRFGIRQQNWLDVIFGQNTMPLRPVTSRDAAGNRYLSWKTDEQPEFTPAFDDIRDEVEFSWRIVEGRDLARKRALEIAERSRAEKRSFEAMLGGAEGLKVAKVEPFTWLTAGSGGQPILSQPEGLQMPGAEFMEAVFDLEKDGTTVAFNEPRTVCYAIRVESLEPAAADLREKFLESRSEPRMIGAVAQSEFSRAFGGWIEGLEKRHGLTWVRQPTR